MPTYDYKCDSCGHAFERFQSMTSNAVKKCPRCGKRKVRRLIGMGAGLIFKGSGFYITDYRSQGYKDAAKGDSAAPATDADSSSSAESKPAATEAKPKAESKPKTRGDNKKK